MGFSRQEYWSRLPFPSPRDLPNPGIEPTVSCICLRWQAGSLPLSNLKCKRMLVARVCPTLFHSMDYNPPGSSVYGSLQARILERVAISYSRGSSWPSVQIHIFLRLLHWPAGSLPPCHIHSVLSHCTYLATSHNFDMQFSPDATLGTLNFSLWLLPPGDGDGQGGLACCNSWGRKESDTTERLNWTELNSSEVFKIFQASASIFS